MRRRLAAGLLVALALTARGAAAADDASAGYEAIRPSLVKVWAFNASGRPVQSGTGIVVESNGKRSQVITATHVVAGAASIRIDVSRDLHDVEARVERTGPHDLTLLAVEHGGLHAARFAPRTHRLVAGNVVAVAGYVKKDELIGVTGQQPRVLFPGTVAARPDNGTYLELENVYVEEGLSGGAVFDPGTGEILGIVTSRTSDRRGGFADSGALVVVPFLAANAIAAGGPPPAARPAPAPRPERVATRDDSVSWQARGAQPKRFSYERAGCRIAVTIDVSALRFVVAHRALVESQHGGALLGITLQQRAAATDACANVSSQEPIAGAYDPTAMTFDGHHVTMRFVYAGDPDDADRFPSDAGVDADLAGDAVTATVQFFARDWAGTMALPLARTPLAAISSTR